MPVEQCQSKFALGVCGWARQRGQKDFCGIADNDPLGGIKKDVSNEIETLDQALKKCRIKASQLRDDPHCLLKDYWAQQYEAYAQELELSLASNVSP